MARLGAAARLLRELVATRPGERPTTFQLVRLRPTSRRIRRLLRRGRDPGLHVVVSLDRSTEKARARARAKL